MSTEWITAVAASISALGVAILLSQVNLLKQQIVDDHERSRREKAVELMLKWTEYVSDKGSIPKKLANNLSNEELKKLLRGKKIHLSKKNEELAAFYFDSKGIGSIFGEVGDSYIELTVAQTIQLKRDILSYLNFLETVLTARDCKVADAEIIKVQFKPLFTSEDSKTLFSTIVDMRVKGDSASFPSIYKFYEEISKTNDKGTSYKNLGSND
ncbi:TPA: hypothetical protein ACN34C_004685 [Vibrio parahaemolyticus]